MARATAAGWLELACRRHGWWASGLVLVLSFGADLWYLKFHTLWGTIHRALCIKSAL